MIYASKVALQQTEELWRRVIKQDDNAVLPREFLGRWCFFYSRCLHRCYYHAMFPPYHVHANQESSVIRFAEEVV